MKRYRQSLLPDTDETGAIIGTRTTDEQALAFEDDVRRLERKAAAQLDDGVSRAAPEFEEQFEIALRAELEDGVRYGDKKMNVMTNVYAEEA